MTISLEDWTFGKDLILHFPTDGVEPGDPNESTPVCRIPSGVGGKSWMFPTDDTIDGESAEGFNNGRLTFWTQIFEGANGNWLRVAFRRTSTLSNNSTFTSADVSAYVLAISNIGVSVRKYVAGATSNPAVFVEAWPDVGSIPRPVWMQHYLRWEVVDGVLEVAYRQRRNPSDDYRLIASGSDASNAYVDDHNKIGFYFDGKTRIEGIHLKTI